ncbi:MAG: ABC transporter permease [Candidatus Doudnabacteria bacterium]|nr:ABC transporter permease [Candidatus Doudnabacteria bacterium]
MLDSISFTRIIKTGLSNFTRNWLLSAAAVLVMTITLIIFAILTLLFNLSQYSVKSIQARVDISIYMKKGLAEERTLDIKRGLEQEAQVKEVVYISARQALDEFKSKHRGNDQVISALNEIDENPLLATLRLKAKNLEDYPNLAEKISTGAYSAFIEKLNYNDNRAVIDRLAKILKIIISLGIGLVAIFVSIAALVMFNTIRLTIYNRREEVEIMRLVGATNWYIRGPFLAEGVLYSLAAAVITAFLLVPIYVKALPKISNFLGADLSQDGIFGYPVLLLGLLAIGLVLSLVSTFLAIRKYLKV